MSGYPMYALPEEHRATREAVRSVCDASSLIPGVNKLGTLPLLLAGSEDVKKRYLSPVAAGTGMFSYCLSEADAGSDAASMKTRTRSRCSSATATRGTSRWSG